MAPDSLQQSVREHLAWWGLRHFVSDHEYFRWQQQQLSVDELKELRAHANKNVKAVISKKWRFMTSLHVQRFIRSSTVNGTNTMRRSLDRPFRIFERQRTSSTSVVDWGF